MDNIKVAKALQVMRKKKARGSYYEYMKYVNEKYRYTRHSEYICGIIDKAINNRDEMLRGERKRETQYIMLNLPPRHGKSYTVTETLPSYFLGKYSDSRVVLTAYSSTLTSDFARKNREKLLDSNLFNVDVLTDNQDRMYLSNKSEMIKAGILGGITGRGANLMIIDDPIKTSEEASSENQRDKIWKEWESSLSTRLENCAIVILIMTRWHEDDLAGRLLNKEVAKPLDWTVVNLPLEAEENDMLGRKIGEPLWEEEFGYDFIEMRKRYPQSFNSLYQGRPTSQEGNIIKRESWQYYEKRDIFIKTLPIVIMTVDATFKDTKDTDKVSIQIWGKKGSNAYMIDNITRRLNFTATLKTIENLLKKYPNIGAKFVEDRANGSAIIDVMNRRIGGFVPVGADRGTGGKVARVHAIEPFITSENVFLPREEWTQDFVEECSSFPNGRHDDQVDAMAMALNKLYFFYANVTRLEIPSSKEFSFEEEEDIGIEVTYSQTFMDSFN